MLLFEPLSPEEMARQADAIMSPPLWDLGHIAAYEELWLVRRLSGGPSLHPDLQDVYDAFETPRARRAGAPMLDEPAAHAYLRAVRERALEQLARADLSDGADPLTAGGFVFEMVAEHEAQHSETVLQALQMLPAGAVPSAGAACPSRGRPCGRGLGGDPRRDLRDGRERRRLRL